MKHIANGFGGTDEQAMIDQFVDRHGRSTLDALDRINKRSYPGIRVSVFDKPKTAREVFADQAAREGFTAEAIRDFAQIS